MGEDGQSLGEYALAMALTAIVAWPSSVPTCP